MIQEITREKNEAQEASVRSLLQEMNVSEEELQDETFQTIFKQLAQNPEQYASLLAAAAGKGPAGPPDADATRITPEPGFVVKTRTVEASADGKHAAGTKVFVNIAHSPHVPAPPPASDDEIRAALSAEDASQYRVPLSLAGPRLDNDKAGAACLVFDACVHSSVLERTRRDAAFRDFIVRLALQWIRERQQVKVDDEQYSVPKLRAKGPLAEHVIRRPKRPGIVELGASASPAPVVSPAPAPMSLKAAYGHLKTPKHHIQLEPPGPKPEFIVLSVSLPDLVGLSPPMTAAEHFSAGGRPVRARGVAPPASVVEVGPERVTVAIPQHYFLQVRSPFPFLRDATAGGAQFDRALRELTVTVRLAA